MNKDCPGCQELWARLGTRDEQIRTLMAELQGLRENARLTQQMTQELDKRGAPILAPSGVPLTPCGRLRFLLAMPD